MRVRAMALAVCVLATGCGTGGGGTPVGAESTLTAGPAAVATPTAGPGVPTPSTTPTATPTTAAPAKPTKITTIEQFETLVTNAIYYKKRKGDPAVKIQRRKYAQYQFIVSWHVSNDANDPSAKGLAQYDASRILNLIQKAELPVYGSVLLLVTAKIKDRKNGATIVTQVVRAKYTAKAVKTAKFTKETVWQQTDDKPATVNPAFR